jgi:hypothetical protein
MATLFGARSRFLFRRDVAASALVATISHSIRCARTALNRTPHVEAPRAFAEDRQSPTSALWILHAR